MSATRKNGIEKKSERMRDARDMINTTNVASGMLS